MFVPAVTATIGFWSTLALNMPDFTRYGRSQREQAVGQVVALPSTMTVFAAMGIIITSATVGIYGVPVWDPIELGGKFENPLIVGVAMFTIMVAMLGGEHRRERGLDGERLREPVPEQDRLRAGGLIAGIIGIFMMPWKLYEDPDALHQRAGSSATAARSARSPAS